MTTLHQFIAGVFFTAVCLFFLWNALKLPGDIAGAKRDIVNFVCALCAGAAGGFFTGAALLSANLELSPNNTVLFQGSAGVALFALVFLLLPKRGA